MKEIIDKISQILSETFKDPGLRLIAVSNLFMLAILGIYLKFMNPGSNSNTAFLTLGVVAGILVSSILGLHRFYQHKEKTENSDFEKKSHALKQEKLILIESLHKKETEIDNLNSMLVNPQTKIISKQDYGEILKEWNESSKGFVLMYNIELQTFENPAEIKRTWRGIAQLKNIEQVILLLPDDKYKRWLTVVLREEDHFFKDPAFKKFSVCNYEIFKSSNPNPPPPKHIAFAMYRQGSDPQNGPIHPKTVFFILSEPFSQLKNSEQAGYTQSWEYHDIFELNGRNSTSNQFGTIWRSHINRTKNIDRILRDIKDLFPIEPATLFKNLKLSQDETQQLLKQFEDRSLENVFPETISRQVPEGDFKLYYNNNDCVDGTFKNHTAILKNDNGSTKIPIVWVGGFTEGKESKLPNLFKKAFNRKAVNQFFYEVSSPPEFITISRYMEDMRNVLKYVNQQNELVTQNKIVLVSRSINGLVGALVASEKEILRMLSGVILVAPVFDVIEMMDNYRIANGHLGVTVEKCWRQEPGFEAFEWKNQGWLEFFGRKISMALHADIIRHGPDKFSKDAFIKSIGKISQKCPVFLLSNSDDPVTGSDNTLELLQLASKTEKIKPGNYKHIEIPYQHIPFDLETNSESKKYLYPFTDPTPESSSNSKNTLTEIRAVEESLKMIFDQLNIPSIEEKA